MALGGAVSAICIRDLYSREAAVPKATTHRLRPIPKGQFRCSPASILPRMQAATEAQQVKSTEQETHTYK